MGLIGKVFDFAAKHRLFRRGDRVLVAVSGGPDSMALLHVLHELSGELGVSLEIAHVDHGMRGVEGRADARAVAATANALGLPYHVKKLNLLRMKKQRGKGNLEALGRTGRYRFFSAMARKRAIDKIATAHTLDDQAETVLMWFLRGCGTRGLSAISPSGALDSDDSANGPMLVRPFLAVSKAEIIAYLRERRIGYRVDRTNRDPAFLRNWIRLRLLPQVERRVGEGWPVRLAHQAELFRDEDRLLDEIALERLRTVRTARGLDRNSLMEQPPALQRRILRLWIAESRGDLTGLDYGHVDAALRVIGRGGAQARVSLPGGWELVNQYKTVTLLRHTRGKSGHCYSYEFEPGMILRIPEAGMLLRSRRVQAPPAARPALPTDMAEGLFDAALLPKKLLVRNFRPGDRFQPLGMTGHKKVKDLFIEKKLPRLARATLPLLTAGGEILWIPACGRSEIAKIGARTRDFLYVEARPLKE